jgi:hypothetical protein
MWTCHGGTNQKWGFDQGRMISQYNPNLCLQRDMTMKEKCDESLWSYDKNSGQIKYVPDGSVLDYYPADNSGLRPYSTWVANIHQVFGDRSRWAPDDPCSGKSRDPNKIVAGLDCGRDRITRGQCIGEFCLENNGQLKRRGVCFIDCNWYGTLFVLQSDNKLVFYNGNKVIWSAQSGNEVVYRDGRLWYGNWRFPA